jgi:MSHA pilin protein MshA
MKKQQSGFTLIELVVVIVLLGILGAAATAKFQNLTVEAANASATGVAAEIASASAINFASSQLNSSTAVAITGAAVTAANCETFADNLLQQGAAATDGWTFGVGGDNACANAGDTVECTLTHPDGDTAATALLLCTG